MHYGHPFRHSPWVMCKLCLFYRHHVSTVDSFKTYLNENEVGSTISCLGLRDDGESDGKSHETSNATSNDS